MTNPRVEDWIAAKCESEKTGKLYLFEWENFTEFCKNRGKDSSKFVDDYRAVKYQGEMQREIFLEEWQDLIRAFPSWLKQKNFAPLTVKNCLTGLKSFLKYWKIPLDVDLPKHACVIWHNRDITREEVKQILTFASARDRVIWLILAESGMRGDTCVRLKYWQIKEDFEKNIVPMRILTPSSTLKDHVGDRWTFIGEDGVRELRSYLQRRLPLKDDDYIFVTEKQGRVKGEQFSPASISVKFNRLVQKLGIDKSVTKKGERPKPKKIRMHGLRKYFYNNIKADGEYRKFWFGHSLGTAGSYISRDIEEHRKEYEKGYEHLRIFEPSFLDLKDLTTQLRRKDLEIKELKDSVEKLSPVLEFVNSFKKNEDLQIYIKTMMDTERVVKKRKEPLHSDLSEENAQKFESLADDLSIALAKLFKKLLTQP